MLPCIRTHPFTRQSVSQSVSQAVSQADRAERRSRHLALRGTPGRAPCTPPGSEEYHMASWPEEGGMITPRETAREECFFGERAR